MMSSNNLSTKKYPLSNTLIAMAAVAVLGFIDAIWLTISYYRGHIGCSVVAGCQNVLDSNYSSIYNVPVALLGALFYAFIIINVAHHLVHKSKLSLLALKIVPAIGFLISLYLIYLQLYIIKAICIYCMLSAATSTLIFILSLTLLRHKQPITSAINPDLL